MRSVYQDMTIWKDWRVSRKDSSRCRISVPCWWERLADPQAGDQVIDVCAAPGGKALHVAEKLWMAECRRREGRGPRSEKNGKLRVRGNCGTRGSPDLTEYKVELIRENIDRSGLANITAVCRDASVPDEESAGKADVVIADLPCSGLGVLGRKADLKYKASREGIRKPGAASEGDPVLREGYGEAGRSADVQYMYGESGGEHRECTLVPGAISRV